MAIKAFELYGEIELRDAKLRTGLRTASKEFTQFEQQAKNSLKNVENQFSRFGSNFGKGFLSSFGIQRGDGIGALLGSGAGNLLQNGVKAITGNLEELFQRGMTFSDKLQQWKLAFANILGNEAQGIKHLQELLKYGHDSAFETEDVIDYAQQLEAVKIKAHEVVGALEGIGGMLARSGKFNPNAMFGSVNAIVQMLAKQSISSEEMTRQLGQYIPDPYGVAARGFNRLGYKTDKGGEFTSADVRSLGEDGRLNANAFVRVLLDQFREESKGMLSDIVSKTISGQKSILEDQKTMVAAAAIMGVKPNDMEALTGAPSGTYQEQLFKMKMRIGEWSGPQAAGAASMLGQGAQKYFQTTNALEEGAFRQLASANVWGDMMKGGPMQFGKNMVGAIQMGMSDVLEHTGLPDLFRKHLGEDLYNEVASYWGIQSPSKKAMQVGEWIREGLEIGLSKSQAGNYANFKKLSEQSPDFIRKLGEVAGRLNTNPDFLLNVFARESSLNPNAYNPSGATGLFQLMPMHAKKLGLPGGPDNKAAFRNAVQGAGPLGQLDLFYRYITEIVGVDSFKDQASAYASVFMPKFTNSAPGAVVAARGSRNYGPNAGLDRNADGRITKAELGAEAFGALGAGRFFSVNGAPAVSKSNPMPVEIVDFGNGVDYRSGPKSYGRFMSPTDFPAEIINRPPSVGAQSRTINDPVPVIVDVTRTLEPLTARFSEVYQITSVMDKPLIQTAEAMKGLTKELLEGEHGSPFKAAEEKKKAKRDKLFDSQFTREGAAGDFQSGFASLLGNLGGPTSPKDLLKGFVFNFARDMQGRMAHDLSSKLTGLLFGTRGEDGKLSGGLNLGSIFGKLFGGFRASGGSMSAGRFYMAGENGPELVSGPGYVHNASQTRQMMSGGENRTIVYFGSEEIGRAVGHFESTSRGRRTRVINAKWGRKLQMVNY